MPKKIRIIIVDDHQMISDSLKMLFGLTEDIDVIDTIHDSRKVLEVLKSKDIDVLVTDYRMPFLDGLQLTQMVKEVFPSLKVLILSVNEDTQDIQDAYRAGASGYVMKKASRKELNEAVRMVYQGELYYSKDAMKAMLNPTVNKGDEGNIKLQALSLTKREIEIVKLLVEEMSSIEIAGTLHISPGTVETHRHNILRKHNVKTTIGVIKFAIKSGIAS